MQETSPFNTKTMKYLLIAFFVVQGFSSLAQGFLQDPFHTVYLNPFNASLAFHATNGFSTMEIGNSFVARNLMFMPGSSVYVQRNFQTSTESEQVLKFGNGNLSPSKYSASAFGNAQGDHLFTLGGRVHYYDNFNFHGFIAKRGFKGDSDQNSDSLMDAFQGNSWMAGTGFSMHSHRFSASIVALGTYEKSYRGMISALTDPLPDDSVLYSDYSRNILTGKTQFDVKYQLRNRRFAFHSVTELSGFRGEMQSGIHALKGNQWLFREKMEVQWIYSQHLEWKANMEFLAHDLREELDQQRLNQQPNQVLKGSLNGLYQRGHFKVLPAFKMEKWGTDKPLFLPGLKIQMEKNAFYSTIWYQRSTQMQQLIWEQNEMFSGAGQWNYASIQHPDIKQNASLSLRWVKKKHHVLSNLNYAFYEYRNVLDYSNYPEKVDWRGIHKGSKSIQWEANYSFVHEKFELRFLYRFDQTEVKYQNNFERMHFVPKHNFVGALHLFHQRNKDISSIEGQRMEWNTRVSGHFDIAHPEQISIPNALILLHSRLILPMDYFRKREFLLSTDHQTWTKNLHFTLGIENVRLSKESITKWYNNTSISAVYGPAAFLPMRVFMGIRFAM